MSTTTVQPTACPAWCTDHLESDGSWIGHSRRVAVGNVAVVIEWCPTDESTQGQPVIPVDDYQWVNGQEARDYAAAIIAACDLIDAAAGDATAAT